MCSSPLIGSSARSHALPSGTLTFLFSDIEGSTSKWEVSPGQMSATLQRHDAILGSAIRKHDGHIFKKMGDAVCSAFERATDAVLAAIDAQRDLEAADFGALGPLRVRMALHTGEAEERDGDYFGPALNRVARLLAVGYGQQVLLSSTTANLVRSDHSALFEVLSLGTYRLRDLTEPEQVFQLCAPELRDQFPRLRSLEAAPNNLPAQLTNFIGREEEIRELSRRLEKARLLTLVGPGGVGKTRLALELGADFMTQYADGVWIVDLGPVTEPDLVESVVASTLNVRSAVGRSSKAQLYTALASKQLLLILDNCEHLIDVAAKVLDGILRKCPNVRCIATSREALRISGESVHHVESLEIPDAARPVPVGQVRQFAAIALFCERAQEATGRFALTDQSAPLVSEICRRLDGLPLAIELTAAQLRVLSLEHVNTRLKERLPLVAGGNRAALPRHLTMESLIDWSYGLLGEAEKRLFRRLGIFSGTFSLDAARDVCLTDESEALQTLALLSRLVEQSLVFVDAGRGTERYRLLETTRQYASAKMRAQGEYDLTAARYASFFHRLVRESDETFHETAHELWFYRLLLELDNVRSALSWAFSEGGDAVRGGELVGRLDRFWFEAGLIHEAQRWIDRAMSLLDEAANPQVVARLWLARALFLAGDEKLTAAERSSELYESIADEHGLAYALRELGIALRQVGRPQEAREAVTRAASLLERHEDTGGLALTLNALGALYAYANEFEEARKIYSESLAVAQRRDAQYAIMVAYLHLADLDFLSADCESAIANALEALNLARGQMNSRFYANVKYNLAAYRIGLNQLERAGEDAREALVILRKNQDSFQVANVVLHLAFLAASAGDWARAARLVAYSDAYLKKHGMEREPTESWVRKRTMEILEGQLPAETIASLLDLGGTMTEERAIREALGPEAEAPEQEPT